MPVNLEYADCPKCGEPIDDDKEAGDKCDECGYVYVATHEEAEDDAEPDNVDEEQDDDEDDEDDG